MAKRQRAGADLSRKTKHSERVSPTCNLNRYIQPLHVYAASAPAQGSVRETLRQENPERGSRPGLPELSLILGDRSYRAGCREIGCRTATSLVDVSLKMLAHHAVSDV